MLFGLPSTLVLLLASTVLALPRPSDPAIVAAKASNSTDSAGTWTVIVDNDDPRTIDQLIKEMGIEPQNIKRKYDNAAFKGFAGTLSTAHVSKMSVMSNLKTFEPEIVVSVSDIQPNAPWGLQRISQSTAIANPPAWSTAADARPRPLAPHDQPLCTGSATTGYS